MLRQSGATQFVSVRLWENLATELSSIIGERGFESLFARSLHLASAAYPWLNPQASGATMLHLKHSMECNSADAAAAAGFDLQLSGHTHGGQFYPWNLFVPLQQPFTAGLNQAGALWVYTSRGTGYWGPPKRFGAPSEITLLRLVTA